jgi:hypothetical protein
MRHNGQTRSPAEIQAEIERTRSELDQTLSAIERRLTPGQLVDQGLDYLKRSGAKEYVDHLGESVKSDPLPLALVGVGLAWLMMSDRGRTRYAAHPSAAEAAASVGERVAQTTHEVGEAAHAARARLGETARAARERASRVARGAREQAERVRGGYERLVDEQPLALGAIGFALGALLAATTPRTRLDERLAGAAAASDDAGAAVDVKVEPASGAVTADDTTEASLVDAAVPGRQPSDAEPPRP